MGAWGLGSFENDDASDWLYELEEASDGSLIEETLKLSEDEYLEAPDGCRILAAIEVLLAASGKERPELPETAQLWVSQYKSALNFPRSTKLAIIALDKILSKESELNELWGESGDSYSDWRDNIETLKIQLKKN